MVNKPPQKRLLPEQLKKYSGGGKWGGSDDGGLIVYSMSSDCRDAAGKCDTCVLSNPYFNCTNILIFNYSGDLKTGCTITQLIWMPGFFVRNSNCKQCHMTCLKIILEHFI